MRRKCQECRLRKCKEMGMLAECEYLCSVYDPGLQSVNISDTKDYF